MTLLASAPTLETLLESIERFYGGEKRTLELERENVWRVINSHNTPMIGVHVIKRGKRFRFETVL